MGVGMLHWKSAASNARLKEGERVGRTWRVMLVGVLRRREEGKVARAFAVGMFVS